MLNVTVDGVELEVPDGATLLDAARSAGRSVPTLCFDERQAAFGACRVCLVGVEGAASPLPACTTPCGEGMRIDTQDPRGLRVARGVIELLLSELPEAPAPHTELGRLTAAFEIDQPRWPGPPHPSQPADRSHPYLALRHDLCISCGRCVRACDEVQVAPALEPPGEAKTDFEILQAVSSALGHEMGYESPAAVMDEIAALTPHFAGVTYERLGHRGLQWPVARDGTDSPTLYEESFEKPDGLARFAALPYRAPGDASDDEFPLVLVTGRILQHYNAGTMTRNTANAQLIDRDWLEIHPADARRLWIDDGDLVSVRSRVGRTELHARVTERIQPGHVFTTFHFPEARTNLLVGASADVNTSCPEYKVVAVDVRPVAEEPTAVPALGMAR